MTEGIPTPEPASPENERMAMTTEMLTRAQSNREARIKELGLTLDSLEKQYPGVFKFLRIAGVIASLLATADAAYAGGPVVRGPLINGPVVHAAKPISHGVIHEAAPINHGISRAPVVRAPGEKPMNTVITTNQATPSNFKETPPPTNPSALRATGSVHKDSRGNVSGNVRGGIDLTPG